MIKLENISVSYGENTVYDKFDFQFPVGINVILGRSGCGKTTLLNVISNLIEYSGKCICDGNIAVVFQDPCLAPVSVWKNIDLVVKKDNEKIQNVLTTVDLWDKKDEKASNLSGGEQQRVSLARAFASEREILLLDEPFANLDYDVKRQLIQVFDKLMKNTSKTVVWVTHDIDECLAVADRVYFLHGSPCTLQQVATIDTAREKREEFDPQTLQNKKTLQQLLQS